MILVRSVDMNIFSKPEKKKWLGVIALLRNQLVHIATVALHAVNPALIYLLGCRDYTWRNTVPFFFFLLDNELVSM
jgi:hypothetical protein